MDVVEEETRSSSFCSDPAYGTTQPLRDPEVDTVESALDVRRGVEPLLPRGPDDADPRSSERHRCVREEAVESHELVPRVTSASSSLTSTRSVIPPKPRLQVNRICENIRRVTRAAALVAGAIAMPALNAMLTAELPKLRLHARRDVAAL